MNVSERPILCQVGHKNLNLLFENGCSLLSTVSVTISLVSSVVCTYVDAAGV